MAEESATQQLSNPVDLEPGTRVHATRAWGHIIIFFPDGAFLAWKSSGCGIKFFTQFAKNWRLLAKNKLCRCLLQNDGFIVDKFPQSLCWHHLRPQILAGLDLELHRENDEHLIWNSQRSSRVEVGRCFWTPKKNAENAVEVTLCKYSEHFFVNRSHLIENDRTSFWSNATGILGVVFHGLSVKPLNRGKPTSLNSPAVSGNGVLGWMTFAGKAGK